MQSSKISSSKSLFRKMIPGLLLGFIILLGLLLFSDVRDVKETIYEFKWFIFPLVFLFTLFNYTLRFIKWHFYLKQIGAEKITWKESLRLFVAGFPLAVTPGKAGEALKAVWLKQKAGVPVGKGISVVLAERISDGLGVLVLSTLGVIAYPRYWPVFALVLGGLLGIIIVSQIRPLAFWFLGLCEKIPLVKKTAPGLREFYEGSFSLFRPKATLIAVGLGTISWFGEGIGFSLVLWGLGLPANWETLATAVFVLAFSTVVGAASALPGGLGAAEISIAGMLALTLGMPAAMAATATLLIRLATFWFGLAIGLVSWIFSPDLLGMKNEEVQIVES